MYKIRCFLSFFNGDKDLKNPSIEIESSFIPRIGEIFILSAIQLSEMNSAVEKNNLKYPFFESSEGSLYLQDYIHVSGIQYESDQISMHLSYYPSDMINVDIHLYNSNLDIQDCHISVMTKYVPGMGEFLYLSLDQYQKLSEVIDLKEHIKVIDIEDYNLVREINYSTEYDNISIYLDKQELDSIKNEEVKQPVQMKKEKQGKIEPITHFISLFYKEFFKRN